MAVSFDLIDLTSAFKERVEELELIDYWPKFVRLGWVTMAKFAFSTDYLPGDGEEKFMSKIVVKILGEDADDHPSKGDIRRLLYESHTLATSDLRRRGESVGFDDVPKPVPAPELTSRRMMVATRLSPGVKLRGELDVSNSALTRILAIRASYSLSYLHLAHCTKMDMEIGGLMKDPMWVQAPNSAGVMVMQRLADLGQPADLDTQLKFSFAMQRKSLLLEMADLVTYEVHEELRTDYLAIMVEDEEPGHSKPSMQQILDADLVLWKLMEFETRGNFKRKTSSGAKPLDAALENAMKHDKFRRAIAPRARPAGARSSAGDATAAPGSASRSAPAIAPAAGEGSSRKALKRKRLKDNAAAKKASAPAPVPPAVGGKAGGKGTKGKSKVNLPPGLIGCAAATADGRRCCFGFNLGGCPDADNGAECRRGWHICMGNVNGFACGDPVSKNACPKRH